MKIYSRTTVGQILDDLASREPEIAAALEERLAPRLDRESRDRVRERQERESRVAQERAG